MKPETNGFTGTYKMFILFIITTLTGFLNCFNTCAQVKICTSIDSVYYVYSNGEWNSEMCVNVEKILAVLNKKSEFKVIDEEHILIYLMKSTHLEEIEPCIKLKPYLMIYKSDTSSPDFMREAKEEELEIEEWMYNPLQWDIKDTIK